MFSIFWPIKLALGILKLLFNGLVLISCILTLMAFMGDKGWVWHLATHFRVQYFALQLLAIIPVSSAYWNHRKEKMSLPMRLEKWSTLVVLAFFAGMNLIQIAPYYLPLPHSRALAVQPGSHLKLMHINLFAFVNQDDKRVIQAIKEADPDMVDLVEYTEGWQHKLERSGIFRHYPYRVTGKGHIALYSKRPLSNARLQYAVPNQRLTNQANIIAQVKLNKEPVTILVAHPASPIQPSHLEWLQQSFQSWQQQRKKLGKNLLIIGDLNTSPWSVEFKTLLQNTGLRDSQLGYGLQPSWPMLLPLFGVRQSPNLLTQLLAIPIDHVLVSEHIAVLSRQTGPFLGSDHLPVTVEIALKE